MAAANGELFEFKKLKRCSVCKQDLPLSEFGKNAHLKSGINGDGQLAATGHGFDRINNAIGYTESNVVACCWRCNIVRGTKLSHEEMKLLGPTLKTIRLRRAGENKEW